MVIKITENDLQNMVRKVLTEYYVSKSMDEGKLARKIGAAALGGMLAFGGGNLSAMPSNGIDTYSQTQAQTQQSEKTDFSNLIEMSISEDQQTGDVTGNYQLTYSVKMDAKTMIKKLVNQTGYSKLNELNHFFPFNDNPTVEETNGMYKITYIGSYQNNQQQKTVFTIYLKNGAFKITAKLNDSFLKNFKGGSSYELMLKQWTKFPKNGIEEIARWIVENNSSNAETESERTLDLQSEFDF